MEVVILPYLLSPTFLLFSDSYPVSVLTTKKL